MSTNVSLLPEPADIFDQILSVPCPACGVPAGTVCEGRDRRWSHINRRRLAGEAAVTTARALIERSSLGTSDAVALRAQTDDKTARQIVERSAVVGGQVELCSDKNGFHDGHYWTPDPCDPHLWCPGYPVPRTPNRTCGYAFVGNVGEFTCDHYAGHEGKHRNYIAEFEWTDEVTR